MKAAFYALVLLNVVFFSWAHWIDAPMAPAPAARTQSLPTLALVQAGPGSASNVDGSGGADVAAAPATPLTLTKPAQDTSVVAVAAATARCRSLGPFVSPSMAQQMAGRLRARGLSPTDRSVDISINDGYTVYLSEAGADSNAQKAVLARLAQAGVEDVHAVIGPRQEPRISLGLFADQARAVRRSEQIRQLGFKPVLDIHQSTVSTHWLDLQLEPNEPTPPLNQLLDEMPGGTAAVTPTVSFSDCPTSTAGG